MPKIVKLDKNSKNLNSASFWALNLDIQRKNAIVSPTWEKILANRILSQHHQELPLDIKVGASNKSRERSLNASATFDRGGRDFDIKIPPISFIPEFASKLSIRKGEE